MALFFASCGDGDDANDNRTTNPTDNVTETPIPTIQGGGMLGGTAIPWTFKGEALRGTGTAQSIRVRDQSDRMTATVTMVNGVITDISVSALANNNATIPTVYTGAGTNGILHDHDRVINKIKELNTWEISSSVRPDTGASVTGGFDVWVPPVTEIRIDENGEEQEVVTAAARVIGGVTARAIKYAVKQAVSDLAYGKIENSNDTNPIDGQWKHEGKVITGEGTVVYKGFMGSGTNGRQDYPYSDNHTVTVTLENGVITEVYGVGSDYGCPYNGNANNDWTLPGWHLRNMELRMLGKDNESKSVAGQPITIEGKNDWNIDVLTTASQSKLYLRSAVYDAIKIIAREQQREQQ